MGVKEIVLGILLGVLATELVSWSPIWAAWLVVAAVRRLPPEMRERMSEEWQGHVDRTPGALGKLYVAQGFMRAAFIIAHEVKYPNIPLFDAMVARSLDILASLYMIVAVGPLCVLLWATIRVRMSGPVLMQDMRLGRDQKTIFLYRFRTTTEGGNIGLFGILMRRSGIDALPTLINLLKGDLTLVGPRAYRSRDVSSMSNYRATILSVRPGIGFGRGGFLSMYHRCEQSLQKEIEIDASIAGRWSLKFVLRCLAREAAFLAILAMPIFGLLLDCAFGCS